MSISLKTRKMLWGRSANRCAICRCELVIDATETDDESIVGDECHIVSKSSDGPRGKSPLSLEQRNKYANLILLCKVHHKQIDDQEKTFPVDKLSRIKNEHIQWVKNSLSEYDKEKQRDEEIYASYIEVFENHTNLDEWQRWSYDMLSSGQPRILKSQLLQLKNLQPWLLSRIWPKRYLELEEAFVNFRLVYGDLHNIFMEHAIERGDDMLVTEKFYKTSQWEHEHYKTLLKRYEFHVDLVEDLMLELTRATNYICDKIRQYITPSYRIQEGAVLIRMGPSMSSLRTTIYLVEYRGDERTMMPYPGLTDFLTLRETRDVYFGSGSEES